MFDSLKALLINARSLVTKIDELRLRVDEEKPVIVGITESWAHRDLPDNLFEIKGFHMIRKDRGSKGGGVVMYIKEGIPFQVIESRKSVESLWCKVYFKRKHYRIGLYYRPPSSSVEYSRDMCEEIASNTVGQTIIMGDFNFPEINWNTLGCPSSCENFRDVCLDKFLHQVVSEPTRGKNILDLVLTSHQEIISGVQNSEPLGNSDHLVVAFQIEDRRKASRNKREMFNFGKADFTKLKAMLDEMDWKSSLEGLSIEQSWNVFSRSLEDAMNNCIPMKTLKTNKSPAWFTNEIKLLASRKKKAWKRYKKCQCTNHQAKYKELEKELKLGIKSAKRDYESKLTKDLKTNPKRFYSYASSKNKSANIESLKKGHNSLLDVTDIAEELNDYFSSTFTISNTPPTVTLENIVSDEQAVLDVDVTKDVVLRKLLNLKETKAPGPDNIYPRVLKEAANQLAEPLSMIFRRSIQEGIVLDDWKAANVTPLHKKGSKTLASNYRPISLTSSPCKILESIIKDHLLKHLLENNVINSTQHGFLPGRSCLTNLIEYLEYVTEAIDSGKAVDCVLLDFSKAFDKVSHNKLLLKLQSVGIRGKILDWIRNWLNCRKQRVVLNGANSKWRSVLSGVPQGSVLGPLLFIIYVNDIETSVKSRVSKFADDTKIYNQISTAADTKQLQHDIDRVFNWAEEWQMKFNVDKCKVINFGNSAFDRTYMIDGKILDSVSSCTDLGVLITNDLKSVKHIDKVVSTANRILGMIYHTVENRTKYIIIPLYRTLVRPHLEYCVQAWRPYLIKDIAKLERVQKRAVNMIRGLRAASYEGKLKELNLFSLEKRRVRGDLISAFRIMNGFDKIPPNMLFDFSENNRDLRGHSQKITKKHTRIDIRKFSFSQRVVNLWNNLPSDAVVCKSVESFKSHIDKHMSNMI